MGVRRIVFICVIVCIVLIYINYKPASETLLGTTIATPAVQETSQPLSSTVLVTYVYDGDTFLLKTGERVRIIGVDAPEWNKEPDKRECYTNESKAELTRLIEGKYVRLEKDVSDIDRYGRLLRHVWLEKQHVGETLVRNGFAKAVVYKPDVRYQSVLQNAQVYAKEHVVGLWANCSNN
jgi:micrococcal nuclease